jgi:hypothetical protein
MIQFEASIQLLLGFNVMSECQCHLRNSPLTAFLGVNFADKSLWATKSLQKTLSKVLLAYVSVIVQLAQITIQ